MNPSEPRHLQRLLRQAYRRLFVQQLLNALTAAWIIALALGVIGLLITPLLIQSPPAGWSWFLLGGLVGLASCAAGLRTWLRRPSRAEVALLIDERFQLSERVTTAFNLREPEFRSSAGQALVADVESQTATLQVAPRFPVRLRWTALVVPLEIVGVVLLVLFPPRFGANVQADGKNSLNTTVAARDLEKAAEVANRRPFVKPVERPNKSEELEKLESELEKLLNQINPEEKNPEVAREKVQKIDELADKLRKLEKEQLQKFANLQEQMKNLEKVEKSEMKSGPAQEMQDDLKRGEIKKAEQDVDRLRKKLQKKELSSEEKEQLADQMQDLQDRVEKLARAREDEKKLKDLIEKAKSEGRDAESLERELKQLQDEMQENAELQKIADKLAKAREAMENGDLEKAADQLQELAKQLGDVDDKLQDIEDVKEHLQRLKEARKGQCKACNGEGEGGDQEGEPKWTKNAKGRGRGAGERPDNPDASTESEDQRIRAGFNPLGRKYYGGSTEGPAFKKQTTAEMAGQIQQAVQDAPEAVEVQRLPKAARDMVREYFERLGGQSAAPPKK